MTLDSTQIKQLAGDFILLRSPNGNHRYESFDFCYSYFKSFPNKEDIANSENIENSCLHLGFYLASWGMLRGSSFLLQNSLRFYKQIVILASKAPASLWSIDADSYTDQNIKALIQMYNQIRNLFSGKRSLTLTTKIMLGLFGSTPALDEYVTWTFRQLYPKCGFRAISTSLPYVKVFYEENKDTIDSIHIPCRKFQDGTEIASIVYPKVKIVDMVMFQYGIKHLKRK